MKFQSWLLLAVLSMFVSFAAGIRHGIGVEKKNVIQQISKQVATQRSSTPAPTVRFREITNEDCKVQYLLPENVASDSGSIVVKCDGEDVIDVAELMKQGYEPTIVASDGEMVSVWVRAPKELQLLLLRTIKSVDDRTE